MTGKEKTFAGTIGEFYNHKKDIFVTTEMGHGKKLQRANFQFFVFIKQKHLSFS